MKNFFYLILAAIIICNYNSFGQNNFFSHNPFTNFNNSANSGHATSLYLNIHTKLKGELTNNGDYLIFSGGNFTLNGITSSPQVSNCQIPTGKIIADNTVSTPVCSFDTTSNTWITRVPLGYTTDDIFICAAIVNSNNGFNAGGSKSTDVNGYFYSNNTSLSETWMYGLSCYQSTFSYSDVAAPGCINPISNGTPAGTPNPVKNKLCAGGSGSGGSNYTGSYSSSDTYKACNTYYASVGDLVWNDANQNGIQDAGEAGIPNVTVKLYNSSDNLINTTTTNSSGSYSFTNLSAGSYYVKFIAPSGYTISTSLQGSDSSKDSNPDASGKTAVFTLTSGQNNTSIDAGMYVTPPAPASLGDLVWNDANQNGIQDAGEAGISNVTVQLYNTSNSLIGTTTTNSSGLYSFTNITPGSYYVQFTAPTGYTISPALQGSDTTKDSNPNSAGKTSVFTLTAGQNNTTIDAGIYVTPPVPASLGDLVWNDANQNGIQDAGEAGISNVTVTLYNTSNNVIGTTTTNSSGLYSFTNITPGGYYVQFTAPTGYTISPALQGSDTTKDSNPDASGKTPVFNLTAGQNNTTIDAGIYVTPPSTASLGDFVWNDANQNGIQDAVETGISNVTVQLYNTSNNLIGTATTNSSGLYSFTNITPGSYYVQFTAPSGYSVSPALQGSDTTIDSNPDVLGKTSVFTLTAGQNNTTIDAGMYVTPPCIGTSATGVDQYVRLTLPSPYNEAVYCGTLKGTVNCNDVDFYCIDLKHKLQFNTQYQSVDSTSPRLTYILNNYYPYVNLPYTGSLSKANEAAAVQLAIWAITDSLNISACTPYGSGSITSIINRALQILSDANANAGTIQPFKTLVINIPNQSFNIGSTIQFYVEAYNQVGAPIKNTQINLSVNEGTLSQTVITTDSTGVAGPISLTAGPNNSTVITATGTAIIPEGTQYYSVANPGTQQKLVIATPVPSSKTVTASVKWWGYVSLNISKTCATVTVGDGDKVTYQITITNTGTTTATGIQVSDVLPSILTFVSSDGNYDPSTGIWTIDSLGVNQSKVLNLSVQANLSQSSRVFDLGVAKDYNVFVLNDIDQPSADAEGRMAVGHDATLANYSVGDKLVNPAGDVLVVGRKLTYTSGWVNGDVAFGSFIDTTHCGLAKGLIHQASPIDFSAATLYLSNLSSQMSVLDQNGADTMAYGMITLTGTDPQINRFNIKGSDLSNCNTLTVNVPSNSVVLINISGDNINWKGGFSVHGATSSNVLLNFFEATSCQISGINVLGSVLAPQCTLNFPSGLISGQVICQNIYGAGQFNNIKWSGTVTLDTTITNFATLVSVNQPLKSVVHNSMAQVKSLQNLSEITGVKSNSSIVPLKMELLQNYPNPFNPSTQIAFAISKEGNYILKIYNMLGQEVATLANRHFSPGNYNENFNASRLSSGIYIYQLTGNNVNLVRKMMLLK
jgi:choice-of-anchor A domain-containing protein/uncharacterized repeat protein (TIGR01451 family)